MKPLSESRCLRRSRNVMLAGSRHPLVDEEGNEREHHHARRIDAADQNLLDN